MQEFETDMQLKIKRLHEFRNLIHTPGRLVAVMRMNAEQPQFYQTKNKTITKKKCSRHSWGARFSKHWILGPFCLHDFIGTFCVSRPDLLSPQCLKSWAILPASNDRRTLCECDGKEPAAKLFPRAQVVTRAVLSKVPLPRRRRVSDPSRPGRFSSTTTHAPVVGWNAGTRSQTLTVDAAQGRNVTPAEKATMKRAETSQQKGPTWRSPNCWAK